MSDTIKVWAANLGTMAVINLSSMQTVLNIVLVIVSIAYTIHKWRKE